LSVVEKAEADGMERMRGCTIRLGEYVLIVRAALGVQITWDLVRARY
jgi:hypothetical protein